MEIESFDPEMVNIVCSLFAETEKAFRELAISLRGGTERGHAVENPEASINALLGQELERGFLEMVSKLKQFKFGDEFRCHEIEILCRVIEVLFIRKNSRACLREIAKEVEIGAIREAQNRFRCFLIKDDEVCRERLSELVREGKVTPDLAEKILLSLREYQLPLASTNTSNSVNIRRYAKAFNEKIKSESSGIKDQDSEIGIILQILGGDLHSIIGACGEEADALSCIAAYYIYVEPLEGNDSSREFAHVLRQKLGGEYSSMNLSWLQNAILSLVSEDADEVFDVFQEQLPLIASAHLAYFMYRRRKISDIQFSKLIVEFFGSISGLPGVRPQCLFGYTDIIVNQFKVGPNYPKKDHMSNVNLAFEYLLEAAKVIREDEVDLWMREARKRKWVPLEKGMIEFWGKRFSEKSQLRPALRLYLASLEIQLPYLLKNWTMVMAKKIMETFNIFLDGGILDKNFIGTNFELVLLFWGLDGLEIFCESLRFNHNDRSHIEFLSSLSSLALVIVSGRVPEKNEEFRRCVRGLFEKIFGYESFAPDIAFVIMRIISLQNSPSNSSQNPSHSSPRILMSKSDVSQVLAGLTAYESSTNLVGNEEKKEQMLRLKKFFLRYMATVAAVF